MQVKKNKIVIIFSIIVILFGAMGCILSFGGVYLVSRLNISGTDSQLVSTVNNSLSSATETLENSSIALKNIANTVEAAKDSLGGASDVLISSSEALFEIARMINFEIIGIRPLEDASQYFLAISGDLETLSGDIDSMSQSLGTNVDDIKTLSTDLGGVSTNLEGVSTLFGESTETGFGISIKSLLYIACVIMASLNVMFILIGSSLLIINK